MLKVWLILARTALSSSLLLKRKSFLRGLMGADLGRSERRFIDIDKIIDLEGDRSGKSINNLDHFKDFLEGRLVLQTEHGT